MMRARMTESLRADAMARMQPQMATRSVITTAAR